MSDQNIPKIFRMLLCNQSVGDSDIVGTTAGLGAL